MNLNLISGGFLFLSTGFAQWLSHKASTCNAGDTDVCLIMHAQGKR